MLLQISYTIFTLMLCNLTSFASNQLQIVYSAPGKPALGGVPIFVDSEHILVSGFWLIDLTQKKEKIYISPYFHALEFDYNHALNTLVFSADIDDKRGISMPPSQIFTYNFKDKKPTQLTHTPPIQKHTSFDQNRNPCWIPGSNKIIWTYSEGTKKNDLMIMNLDGDNPHTVFKDSNPNLSRRCNAVSNDGKLILIAESIKLERQQYSISRKIYDPSWKLVQTVSGLPDASGKVRFSMDNKLLHYMQIDHENFKIQLMQLEWNKKDAKPELAKEWLITQELRSRFRQLEQKIDTSHSIDSFDISPDEKKIIIFVDEGACEDACISTLFIADLK